MADARHKILNSYRKTIPSVLLMGLSANVPPFKAARVTLYLNALPLNGRVVMLIDDKDDRKDRL
ncbi:hypothetical protein K7W03_08245 [Sphingobium sp. PNB]|uniref:hypothetical protein n=1 Tax=Sphingobium sp. PNB TaxID=863934 RepID=UPI001CA4034F|nr:hypothetical protein [Sphingobium sp. PNB]MCB4859590.1 hypothetical protein [Sphingobium sp. PNB]